MIYMASGWMGRRIEAKRVLAAGAIAAAVLPAAPAAWAWQARNPAPPAITPAASPAASPAVKDGLTDADRAKAEEVLARAIDYLRAQQDPASGGWAVPPEGPKYPAITGLVVNGMLMQPGIDAADEAVARGVDFMLRYRQPDGGIYDRLLPSYNTAICLSALSRVDTPAARAAVGPAQAFLKSLQYGEASLMDGAAAGETRRVDESHPFYGGVGYGRHGRPDNSNLNKFMQALADSGVAADDPAVQRALVFLRRTQMLDGANEMPYADGSEQGGFVYSSSVSGQRVGEGQSYAGEIAESLSGPPGTEVVFEIAAAVKDPLGREQIEKRLSAAAAEHAELQNGFAVLLGPTSDGRAARSFAVRTPVRDEAKIRAIISAAFADLLGETPRLAVRPVEAWQGVSRLRAYGSMTYAGFRSYIYAQLPRDDVRVRAALGWITRNYTLEENPGVGTDGLYYYFVTFARALKAWGEPELATTGADGDIVTRNWRKDLIDRLAGLQNPDGSFRSVDDRWMENNPVLITAYSVLALQNALR